MDRAPLSSRQLEVFSRYLQQLVDGVIGKTPRCMLAGGCTRAWPCTGKTRLFDQHATMQATA